MDNGSFDVIIIGTGLTESITAAALAKAGFQVAHVDQNHYYGGNEASLSLDELVQWADSEISQTSSRYSSVSRSATVPSQSRQYSICLSPSVIPSVGPMISSLVSSSVAKYGGFRLLERVGVYHPSGLVKSVPGTKEDVFKNKEIGLVDKRRLMRFLVFAAGEFEDAKEFKGAHDSTFGDFLKTIFLLNDDIRSALVFALAFCISSSDSTVPALYRIRRYLRSIGRYGPSPFLIGHYGGAGEISQGFCRAAAVSGAVYILGRRIQSVTHSSTQVTQESQQQQHSNYQYSVVLNDFPDILRSHIIIASSTSYLPSHLTHLVNYLPNDQQNVGPIIARCIAIVDQGINFPSLPSSANDYTTNEEHNIETTEPQPRLPSFLDAGIIVFPPSSVAGGSTSVAATLLVAGEGTMSAPKGKWILYISLPLSASDIVSTSAEELLRPYLDVTLTLTTDPNYDLLGSSPPLLVTPVETPSTPIRALPKPLFTTFYYEHPESTTPSSLDAASCCKTFIVPPALTPSSALPEMPDAAATHAETAFWETIKSLRDAGIQPKGDRRDATNDNVDSGTSEVDNFWPPLRAEEESEEDE